MDYEITLKKQKVYVWHSYLPLFQFENCAVVLKCFLILTMSKKHIKTNKTIYTTVNDDYQNILTTQTFDCMGTACSSNFNLEYAAIRNYKH